MEGKHYGIYRGSVFDNEDPENMGRLQLYVPAIYGAEPFRKWALPKGMYSGKGIGSFFLPNKLDTVWVQFEGGDARFPVWDYGWFLRGAAPEGSSPKVKVIQTTTKQRIVFDDDNKLIRVEDSHGNKLELNEKGVSVVSGKISLGKLDGSAEPVLLGNTAVTWLSDFAQAFIDAKTTTVLGAMPLLTAPMVAELKAKINELKSKVTTTE